MSHSLQKPMRNAVRIVSAAILAAAAAACTATVRGPGAQSGGGTRSGGAPPRGLATATMDPATLYLRQGLIAASGSVPFVGRVAFFAGPSRDSSLALVSISLPARALNFVREGDRYRAAYMVVADLKSQTGTTRVVDATEAVRVMSATETQRNEESVIFQRYFPVLPGTYQLTISVRDQVGGRASSYDGSITVPSPLAQGISTALVVHQAELRTAAKSPPRLIASPRATGVFGRDSLLLTYVETYGNSENRPVKYALVSETGTTLWTDSVAMTGSAEVSSGMIRIPVTGVGVGVGFLRLWLSGSSDTVRTPLFVGFGEDLPVASFNDMLSYLRYYVNPARLNEIRTAAEDQKAEKWSALMRESDPVPTTPQHEGLVAYFQRIRRANDLYRGEMTDGWLTDRGKVYITLGEPDQYGSSQPNAEVFGRIRNLIWEYRRFSLRLLFQDRSGVNRWELDPSSEAEFNAIAQRERIG